VSVPTRLLAIGDIHLGRLSSRLSVLLTERLGADSLGPAAALRQAVALRMETVGQFTRFAWAISGVVLVIGGLVVLTTMLGAVVERRQEIGLFRATGFRRTHIMGVILAEAALVSLLGGLLGWLIGMIAATALAPGVAQVTIPVHRDPWLAAGAIGAALTVGLLASLYPAVRAAQLDPTTALRAL
jgi:putative ABC transport system permease protein